MTGADWMRPHYAVPEEDYLNCGSLTRHWCEMHSGDGNTEPFNPRQLGDWALKQGSERARLCQLHDYTNCTIMPIQRGSRSLISPTKWAPWMPPPPKSRLADWGDDFAARRMFCPKVACKCLCSVTHKHDPSPPRPSISQPWQVGLGGQAWSPPHFGQKQCSFQSCWIRISWFGRPANPWCRGPPPPLGPCLASSLDKSLERNVSRLGFFFCPCFCLQTALLRISSHKCARSVSFGDSVWVEILPSRCYSARLF